jgi:hypothetical protein
MSLPDRRDHRVCHDRTGSRMSLVLALKELVSRRLYDVPSADVADHIIRDALPRPSVKRARD